MPVLMVDREVSEQRKLEALLEPSTYSDASAAVEVVETHCSWVFLTRLYAYKMKKAMVLDRMDNRELTSRRRSCEEELRLNRRLAPTVYLDVASLNLTAAGALRLDEGGTPVEWLVKMLRLPRAGFLDRALASHTVSVAALDSVARLLADFYVSQPPIIWSAEDYLAMLERQMTECALALRGEDLGLPRALVEAVLAHQRRAFDRCRGQLGQRAQQGRIREGHGDLKPEHVFLATPPCIIDCLEFARDLRILDPIDELAYFATECERIGAAWVATGFIDRYLERSHDHLDPAVYEFYRMRRAAQRARTLAWHVRDVKIRQGRDWRALAIDMLEHAGR